MPSRVEPDRCVDAERTDLDAQVQQGGAVGQPLTAVALIGAPRVRPAGMEFYCGCGATEVPQPTAI